MKNLLVVIVSLITLVACSGAQYRPSVAYEDDYFGNESGYHRIDSSLHNQRYDRYYSERASTRAEAGTDELLVDRYSGYNNQGYSLHSGRYGSYTHSSRGYGGYRQRGGFRYRQR